MAKDTHRFRCPCCHKQLELDGRTGKAREVDAMVEAPERSAAEIKALMETQARDAERLGDAFSRAKDDALHQADKFDALFDDALEDAKKDKDKKPRNPFDMD